MIRKNPALADSDPTTASVLGDRRGAVLVEFVVAIVPLLTMFFSFVQLAHLATARIVLKHATIIGARAASVLSNEHENVPEETKDGKRDNKGEITQAVKLAMGPMADKAFTNIQVNVTDLSSREDPFGWVIVDVTATHRCTVPLGKVICAALPPARESYRLPHQGAIYDTRPE